MCSYIWQTLPPFWLQNSVLGSYFPLREACLFSYRKKNILSFYHYPIKIVSIEDLNLIPSLKLQSAPFKKNPTM